MHSGGKKIPAEQKSESGMHPDGRNNPCGTNKHAEDAFSPGKAS